MVEEAKLERTEDGLVPRGPGWFVLNAREAAWVEGAFGRATRFEGADAANFRQLGINVGVLEPGQPSCMYHGEADQEDFLVLSGECLLLVEGQERPLRAWDFVHCPPWTKHVFVGAGEGPCVLLGVGARTSEEIVYPRDDLASLHGAGVERETSDPREAYAAFPEDEPAPYRAGDLP